MTLSVTIRHRFPGFKMDAAFDAPAGVTAIFGRSGSGKTTAVNAIAGLLRPDAGRIEIGGRVLFDSAAKLWVPPHRRRVGYVFQEGRLFPHLTVRQNLRYGLTTDDGAQVARVVDLLGIGTLLARRPIALSGGEKQRVAIGRALLAAPRLLLMDEPLAALDEARKSEILPYLERLRDETEIPFVYVSHVVAEIARLATTVVVLRDGRVVRSGPADEVLGDPAVSPSLGVRGAGAVLTVRVARHHADGLTELAFGSERLFLPRIDAVPGAWVRVRIAAQDVMIATARPEAISALNIIAGEVRELRPGAGPGMMVVFATGAQTILARITRRSCSALGLAPGVACYAVVKTVAVAPEDVGAAPKKGPDA